MNKNKYNVGDIVRHDGSYYVGITDIAVVCSVTEHLNTFLYELEVKYTNMPEVHQKLYFYEHEIIEKVGEEKKPAQKKEEKKMGNKRMCGIVRGVVYEVMKNDLRARNDDHYLYGKVLDKIVDTTGVNLSDMTATYFFTNAKYMNIPSFESVSRTRRWWQEHDGAFKLTAEEKREKQEQVEEVKKMLGYK